MSHLGKTRNNRGVPSRLLAKRKTVEHIDEQGDKYSLVLGPTDGIIKKSRIDIGAAEVDLEILSAKTIRTDVFEVKDLVADNLTTGNISASGEVHISQTLGVAGESSLSDIKCDNIDVKGYMRGQGEIVSSIGDGSIVEINHDDFV